MNGAATRLARAPLAGTSSNSVHTVILQRKCACDALKSPEYDACDECQSDGLQRKLAVGSSHDPLEFEADRVADQVLGGPVRSPVSTAPPHIHRATSQPQHSASASPASVGRTLTGAGSPLEEGLRTEMEERFGHDFSQVRVHADPAAAQSARDVNATAYTVGSDVVFGAGRFAPHTHAGRRLLAHELTHVVQQTQTGAPACTQRQVQREDLDWHDLQPLPMPMKGGLTPDWANTVESYDVPQDSFIYWWSFEGTPRVLPCPGCHQTEEKHLFKSNRVPTKWVRVQLGPLLQWAVGYVWDACQKIRNDRTMLSLLQRQKVDALLAIFDQYQDPLVEAVRKGYAPNNDRLFEGSDEAKEQWSKRLRAEWKPQVMEWLYQRAENWLVDEVVQAEAVKGSFATLVTDPEEYARIEDHPDDDTINIGGAYNQRAGVGFEWLGRRAVSVSPHVMYYHVLKHKRIYFAISPDGLNKAGTFAAKVFGDVAKAAEGLAVVGSFVKGVFGVVTGFGESIIDAGAKLIDMQTQFVAVVGKATGWYHVGYSCLSSTCKQYQAGVKQSDLLMSAFADATAVVPLVQQARECISKGNAEACGGLTGAAFMGVFKMKSKASRGIAKELARDKINRPAGRTAVAAAAEELAARGKRRAQAEEAATKAAEREKALADEATARQARQRAKTPDQLRMEDVVHTAARIADSEIKIGKDTHGVAPTGKGDLGGFQLCTSCSLVARKLALIEKILPEGTDLRRSVEHVRRKAEGYDKSYRKGELTTQEMRNRASKILADDLKRDVVKNPLVELMLVMTLEDLRKNHAKLKKEAAAPPLSTHKPAKGDVRATSADLDPASKQPLTSGPAAAKTRPPHDMSGIRAPTETPQMVGAAFDTVSLKPGQDAIYILRDAADGTILKVGKTSEKGVKQRARIYRDAARIENRTLEWEVYPLKKPRTGTRDPKTAEFYEKKLRAEMESQGHRMPWDNTNRRLGRKGFGTPGEGVRRSKIPKADMEALLWKHKGDVAKVGAELGKSAQTARLWAKGLGLDPKDFKK